MCSTHKVKKCLVKDLSKKKKEKEMLGKGIGLHRAYDPSVEACWLIAIIARVNLIHVQGTSIKHRISRQYFTTCELNLERKCERTESSNA